MDTLVIVVGGVCIVITLIAISLPFIGKIYLLILKKTNPSLYWKYRIIQIKMDLNWHKHEGDNIFILDRIESELKEAERQLSIAHHKKF